MIVVVVGLVGFAVIDNLLFGPTGDRIDLKLLYVTHDYRKKGIGVRLFDHAMSIARSRGAAQLYVSSTPTQNTVDFYFRRGCRLATVPDAKRLAAEPEDIHLLCDIHKQT